MLLRDDLGGVDWNEYRDFIEEQKMKIECEVEEVELKNDHGREVPGVRVTCGECEHSTESFGTGSVSIRRCFVLLREECPNSGDNYYVTDGDDR
jgi:hypothetical protein